MYGSVVTPFFTVDWPIVFPFILNAVFPDVTFTPFCVVTVACILIFCQDTQFIELTSTFVEELFSKVNLTVDVEEMYWL
ncbi:hypothetical protein CA615_05135 [Methanosphaera stadtmanae]|uniref:Uncharacterized protein n=1 Tax=Methanosphaera stadtmanae TaxID=2317 RepID=A0A328Q5L7_9EURY|nr:hypothetical protein CA615_05135 [Methanosphaera stadtmanae]